MIDGTEAAEAVGQVAPAQRPEPPTNLMPIPAPEVATVEVSVPAARDPEAAHEAEPTDAAEPTTTMMAVPSETSAPRPEPATTGSVWPGLTAAGLPARVPRQADDESIKEAFFDSWEATPTSPTPLTRPPFTPTYLGEPPHPRTGSADDLPPYGSMAQQPPDPREPPDPAAPPEPHQPPEPKEPPAPPTPPPGPTPFPSPTPVPTPPEPVPPTPMPTPPIPPGPPVPTPPAPFPPPPGPVPPPPAIVPGADTPRPAVVPGRSPASVPGRPGPSVYQGGNYAELETEPITMTGFTSAVTGAGVRESAVDRSGSLTGHLLSREMRERREKRRRMKAILWVISLLLLFGIGIATVVIILAGDFLGGLFDTFSRWAG